MVTTFIIVVLHFVYAVEILNLVVVPVPMTSSLPLVLPLAVVLSRQVIGTGIIAVIIVVRF